MTVYRDNLFTARSRVRRKILAWFILIATAELFVFFWGLGMATPGRELRDGLVLCCIVTVAAGIVLAVSWALRELRS